MADFGMELSGAGIMAISSLVSGIVTAVAFRIRSGGSIKAIAEVKQDKTVERSDCLLHMEENRRQHDDFYVRIHSLEISRATEVEMQRHMVKSLEDIKTDLKSIIQEQKK